jgi:PhnB protein
MTGKVNPVPEGLHGATPYLCCKDAARAIDFYRRAFGATESMRLAEPSGKIGHAEIKIGGAVVMLSDEYPEMSILSPQSLGGTPVGIHIYVDDVDALVEKAVAAGASLARPVADQFYGDRSGVLTDPFGHRWFFATHKEDVSSEEMQKRYDRMMKQ